jgi:PD-(D/E)XK nuclease superfamily
MTFEVTELARRFAPWSISKLNVAETCGKQFEFKHVLKHAEIIPGTDNRVGLALHAVLEHRLHGKLRSVAIELALEKHPLTSDEMTLFRSMFDAVEEFLRKLDVFCRQHGPVEMLIEHKWGLTADGQGTAFDAPDVFFRGVLDLGIVTRDRDLIVIDHKAGKPRGLDKYKSQLRGYAVLGRANVPFINGVRSALHYLQEQPERRLLWGKYIELDAIGEKLVPWLYEYINDIAGQLSQFTPKPGFRWPCQWCAYRPACNAFAEMTSAA